MHLTLAHFMKIRRRTLDLTILGEAGWILFIWAMYGLICQLILGTGFVMPAEWSIPLFKVSLTLILLFTAPSFNIFKSVFAGLLSILQNASAAFSDILSYIRLWAVGLAGGKVAQAFNNIGAMLPPVSLFGLSVPLLKLPIWIMGHGINIILCIIGILAHGVRLNLLEFSNHLELDWAGRKYDPFKEIK
jgi:V/A-type H+-transporting ATPase subunit I